MEPSEAIAKRIRELCKEKGMSRSSLAVACGEPEKRVYRAMVGALSSKSLEFLSKMCKALGVSLSEFFDTDELRDAFEN